MNKREFYEKYPELSAVLVDEFQNAPADKIEREVALGIGMQSGLAPQERHAYLLRLVNEAHLLLTDFDSDWSIFSEVSFRTLPDIDSARTWLKTVISAWEERIRMLK